MVALRKRRCDEGNKGVLSSMQIENRVWAAIVVILFAGIPFIPVNLSNLINSELLTVCTTESERKFNLVSET